MAEPITLSVTSRPAARAAELIAEALAVADARTGSARLAIPGGSALAAVGPARVRLGVIWRRVRLTWCDERCVPSAHPHSNRGMAFRSGALSHEDPPRELLPLFLDRERPENAVARVERELTGKFDGGLDVALLGLGADGHVASLFPGAVLSGTARVVLATSSAKPPSRRITLTQSMLATAADAVVFASGESKRVALVRLLDRDPALAVSALPRVSVVTDIELRSKESV